MATSFKSGRATWGVAWRESSGFNNLGGVGPTRSRHQGGNSGQGMGSCMARETSTWNFPKMPSAEMLWLTSTVNAGRCFFMHRACVRAWRPANFCM